MTSYNDFKQVLEGYQRASETHEKIAHYNNARESAAQFALEELGQEQGQVEAEILLNPETPIETISQGLGLSLERRNQKLEELVENKFDEILNDKNVKKEKLEVSLLSFNPKKDVSGKYKKLAEYHSVYRNIQLYQNREQIEKNQPEVINQVLNEMIKDLIKYYENQFKEEKGDSKEDKRLKEKLKKFFLSLYIRNGSPVADGRPIAEKYSLINKDKLKEFGEKVVNTKESLADYIKATLPEDKNTRLNFLGRLME